MLKKRSRQGKGWWVFKVDMGLPSQRTSVSKIEDGDKVDSGVDLKLVKFPSFQFTETLCYFFFWICSLQRVKLRLSFFILVENYLLSRDGRRSACPVSLT